MRGNSSHPFAAALLVVVLVATQGVGAEAKKRRKKQSHKRAQTSAPAPATPSFSAPSAPAAVAAPAVPAVPAGPPVQELRQQVQQQLTSVKEQAQKIVDGYSTENKQLTEQYNKLVSSYNDLVTSHQDLIKKFNGIVDELQDPSLATFLTAKAIQISHHPGIEGAVNKTVKHVLPIAQEQFLKGHQQGTEWFNKTQASVQNFLEAHGGQGQDWVPVLSGFVVYGSVAIPLVVACWCVLEFVCKLQLLVLFGHIYMAVTGMILAAIAISSDTDPLSTFAEHDPQLYQFAQVCFALLFVTYGGISMCSACFGKGDASWRFLNTIVVILFGAMYYILIWTPAMLDELPKVDDFVEALWMPEVSTPANTKATATDDVPVLLTATPYLIIAVMFTLLFLFESSSSSSKERKEEDPEAKGD